MEYLVNGIYFHMAVKLSIMLFKCNWLHCGGKMNAVVVYTTYFLRLLWAYLFMYL